MTSMQDEALKLICGELENRIKAWRPWYAAPAHLRWLFAVDPAFLMHCGCLPRPRIIYRAMQIPRGGAGVARLAHAQQVAGSNPALATTAHGGIKIDRPKGIRGF